MEHGIITWPAGTQPTRWCVRFTRPDRDHRLSVYGQTVAIGDWKGPARPERAERFPHAARILQRLVSALTILFWTLAPVFASEPLVVVVTGPMSGPLSISGLQMQLGANAAFNAMADKSLLGRPITINVLDDLCDPKIGLAIAHKLIVEKPAVVIGPDCSGVTLAVEQLYADADILEISASSTASLITERGLQTFFRMIGRDDTQGIMGGTLIAKRWPKKRVAVLNDGRAFGDDLTQAATDALRRLKHPPALIESFQPEAVSYLKLAQRLDKAGISIVYFGGYQIDAALLLLQARAIGLALTLVGGDPLISSDFWTTASHAGEGTLFTAPPDLYGQPAAQAAVAAFKAKGIEPTGYTLLAYAAFQTWVAGVKRASTAEAKAVATAIRAKPINTVIGTVAFDAKGDIERTGPKFSWYRWHDGQAIQVRQNNIDKGLVSTENQEGQP